MVKIGGRSGLVVLFFLVFSSCGSQEKSCPDGYILWHDHCVLKNKSDGWDAKVVSDTKDVSLLEVEVDESWNVEILETPDKDIVFNDDYETFHDLPKDWDSEESSGSFKVGDPCFSDTDCKFSNAVCLGWGNGYCSVIDCPGINECPAGSTCFTLAEGMRACLLKCESNDDCRTSEGFFCKTFVSEDNAPLKVCYPVNSDASSFGGPCKTDSDCGGSLICNHLFPNGYCTTPFCEGSGCGDDGECVKVSGVYYCLKKCETDTDCLYNGMDTGLSCRNVKNLKGKTVSVCHTSVTGKPIGEKCLNDFECESNFCVIVKKGQCAGSHEFCLSDLNCPAENDFCLVTESEIQGVCSESCSVTKKCPATGVPTFCASQGKTGVCMVGCLSTIDCPIKKGMKCIFGDPINSEIPGGTSICYALLDGETGASCSSDDECLEGYCFKNSEGTKGYCIKSCPYMWNETCPFPTACVKYEGDNLCLKRCSQNSDCPDGFSCIAPPGEEKEFCIPQN